MGNYYNLLDTLKGHFDNDAFINTVTEGDIFAVDLSKQTIFPLAHIIVNNSTIENNVIRFNVSILSMDIVEVRIVCALRLPQDYIYQLDSWGLYLDREICCDIFPTCSVLTS